MRSQLRHHVSAVHINPFPLFSPSNYKYENYCKQIIHCVACVLYKLELAVSFISSFWISYIYLVFPSVERVHVNLQRLFLFPREMRMALELRKLVEHEWIKHFSSIITRELKLYTLWRRRRIKIINFIYAKHQRAIALFFLVWQRKERMMKKKEKAFYPR